MIEVQNQKNKASLSIQYKNVFLQKNIGKNIPTKQVQAKQPMSSIKIHGARVNNLKNISVEIPKGKLVVITGLSGSGKSSLAFDTLFAEGQRRYVESLSSYARQFMGRMAKPEVDYISGISPAVAIAQKVNTSNPRSTVGTSTEIYEYLKLIYARIGRTYSPISGTEVKRHSVSDVVDHICALDNGSRILICAPLQATAEQPMKQQLEMLNQEGFVRIIFKGTVIRIEDLLSEWGPSYDTEMKASGCQLLIDRMVLNKDDDMQTARVSESVQAAFFEGRGACEIHCQHPDSEQKTTITQFSNRFEADGITFVKPNPNFFSFNNPYGACQHCQGKGYTMGISEDLVVPNKTLSVFEDAIVCWRGDKMSEWKTFFIRNATRLGFQIHTPYCDLSQRELDILWNGEAGATYDQVPHRFPGILGFFKWIESQAYKIQYRVMLARYRGKTVCPVCRGSRLRQDATYVKIQGKSIVDLSQMPVSELAKWLRDLQLTEHERAQVGRIMTELHNRVGYLENVGLGYLTLGRHSNTLSGGESQRINLATSLGSSLVGSLYILDEPSIGLHSRDTDRLISVLRQLRDLGNTVVVVEHDEEIIRAADYIIDIGPGAGRLGGEVVFAGKLTDMTHSNSLTAQYITGKLSIPTKKGTAIAIRDRITLRGVVCNNIKHLDVDFPLHMFTVVTGVSGSGKTTLVKQVLYDILKQRFDGNIEYMGHCTSIEGDINRITSVELVDQNPIGKSSRSNPATYMKAYDQIRHLYASQPLAKSRGYKPGFFSFNTEGGRCEHCQGEGHVTIGMQFMADVHLVCDECHGTRFREETLEVLYKGKNISEVLDMTINQAIDFFAEENDIVQRLRPLQDVGLGYLKLGQSSSSLSGGEAQRVKLASFLLKGAVDNPVLFIFDEPSTGLHFHDIQKLLDAFNTLVSNGHSIIVIEHNVDIIKVADWVIDMGPEGGNGGGKIVFAGPPTELVKCPQSYTAAYLKEKIKNQ